MYLHYQYFRRAWQHLASIIKTFCCEIHIYKYDLTKSDTTSFNFRMCQTNKKKQNDRSTETLLSEFVVACVMKDYINKVWCTFLKVSSSDFIIYSKIWPRYMSIYIYQLVHFLTHTHELWPLLHFKKNNLTRNLNLHASTQLKCWFSHNRVARLCHPSGNRFSHVLNSTVPCREQFTDGQHYKWDSVWRSHQIAQEKHSL